MVSSYVPGFPWFPSELQAPPTLWTSPTVQFVSIPNLGFISIDTTRISRHHMDGSVMWTKTSPVADAKTLQAVRGVDASGREGHATSLVCLSIEEHDLPVFWMRRKLSAQRYTMAGAAVQTLIVPEDQLVSKLVCMESTALLAAKDRLYLLSSSGGRLISTYEGNSFTASSFDVRDGVALFGRSDATSVYLTWLTFDMSTGQMFKLNEARVDGRGLDALALLSPRTAVAMVESASISLYKESPDAINVSGKVVGFFHDLAAGGATPKPPPPLCPTYVSPSSSCR